MRDCKLCQPTVLPTPTIVRTRSRSTAPVDGRASNPEQVGELSGAALPALKQGHQMRFLSAIELGLPATQTPFGLGDLDALFGGQPNQVLPSNHREHSEQRTFDVSGDAWAVMPARISYGRPLRARTSKRHPMDNRGRA